MHTNTSSAPIRHVNWLSPRLFSDDLHRYGRKPIQLLVASTGEQRLRPQVLRARGISLEQPTQERDQRNPLERRAAIPLHHFGVGTLEGTKEIGRASCRERV